MKIFIVAITLVLLPLARPQSGSGSGSGSGMMSGSGSGSGSGMMSGSGSGSGSGMMSGSGSGSGSGMMSGSGSGSGSGMMSGSGSGMMSGSGSGMMSGSGSGMMSGSGSGMMARKLSTLQNSLHGSGRSMYRKVKHHGVGSRMTSGGGKITISKNDDPTTDKNAIEFEPCQIDELDSSGNMIGTGPNIGQMTPSTTHSIGMTMMKAKNATLGMPMNATAGTGSGGSGIDIQKTSNNMSLGGGKMMKIDMSTYDASGNVSTGTEKWEVGSGDIELDFTLSGWTFCTNCTGGSQSGSQIEMKFCMKSNKMPAKKSMANRMRKLSGGAEEYDVGDSGNMVLSKQLWCDGAWKNMTSGYPSVQTNSMGGSFIIIRLPKFATSCKWDPTIASSSSSDAAVVGLSVCSLLFAVVAKLM